MEGAPVLAILIAAERAEIAMLAGVGAVGLIFGGGAARIAQNAAAVAAPVRRTVPARTAVRVYAPALLRFRIVAATLAHRTLLTQTIAAAVEADARQVNTVAADLASAAVEHCAGDRAWIPIATHPTAEGAAPRVLRVNHVAAAPVSVTAGPSVDHRA